MAQGDSLLDSLENIALSLGAGEENAELLTPEELAIRTGKSVDYIKERLKLLAAAGRLVIGKKKQMQLDGKEKMVAAYGIKSADQQRPKKRR